jgi:hypothetical protein
MTSDERVTYWYLQKEFGFNECLCFLLESHSGRVYYYSLRVVRLGREKESSNPPGMWISMRSSFPDPE